MAPKRKSSSKSAPKVDEAFAEPVSILKFWNSKAETEAFREPVDWKFLGLTDYPEIIKRPMDLQTLQGNLEGGKYDDVDGFAVDARLVWKNAMTYNQPGSDIFKVAEKYYKLFEKRWSKFKKGSEPASKKSKKTDAKEVSRADRIKFSQLVNQLTSDELEQLVKMIKKECREALTEESDDELEIEINNIDAATLTNLNAFCNKCIKKKRF